MNCADQQEAVREHIVQTLALAYAQEIMWTYRQLILSTIADPGRQRQQVRSWTAAFAALLGMFHERGVIIDLDGDPVVAAAVPRHDRMTIHVDAIGIADDCINAIVEVLDWADVGHAVDGLASEASRLAAEAGAEAQPWPARRVPDAGGSEVP